MQILLQYNPCLNKENKLHFQITVHTGDTVINPLREAHKSESETLKVDDFRGTSWGRQTMS